MKPKYEKRTQAMISQEQQWSALKGENVHLAKFFPLGPDSIQKGGKNINGKVASIKGEPICLKMSFSVTELSENQCSRGQ